MITREIVEATHRAIERSEIPYLIVGALATVYHSFPRATNDADFVVAAPLESIREIATHFPSAFHVDPQPQMEMLTGTFRWIIEIDGAEFRVEIFHLGNDPHHQEMFQRRISVTLADLDAPAWIPTAEDLVIQKLRWARRKDLDDAQNILAVQGEAIDFAHLEMWCARHGTLDRLREIREAIPSGL